MTRLNNNMRDAIKQNAVKKAGLYDKLDDLKERRAVWAEEVRLHFIGDLKSVKSAQRRIDKILSDLPESIVRTKRVLNIDIRLHINIAGRYVTVYYNGGLEWEDKAGSVLKVTPEGCVLTPVDPLADQFMKLDAEYEQVQNEIIDIRNQVGAAVNSVNTVKQLLEAWPEAAELLPDGPAKTAATLPAVTTDSLNKLIGLPSNE